MTATGHIEIQPMRTDVRHDRAADHELRFEARSDGDVELEISAVQDGGKRRPLHEYLIGAGDALELLELLQQLTE